MKDLNMKVNTVDMDVALRFYTKVIGLDLQHGTGNKNIINQPGVHIEFQKIK